MEDWDLLAVVRGRNINNNAMESPSPSSSCFVPLSVQDQDDLFKAYPHLFETTVAFDELEELYKPFYPGSAVLHSSSSSSSSLSSSSSSVLASFKPSLPKQAEERMCPKPDIAKEPANKYKKRKNQQKRVVKEVREDGLSSDMWAWRKYGQKPIKGSPYPRSYYRCSSSKGCSARKQVERSASNPEIFIITYTAEHSHAHPARRSSLSGSTRTKFPSVSASKDKFGDDSDDKNLDCSSKDEMIMQKDDEFLDGDSTSSEIEAKNVVSGHENRLFYASLEDLERGLEELDHEEASKNDESELLLLDGGFFDDHFIIDANWHVDQFNTTVSTGAC